jgi:uncharacterized protein YecE (DUF72 family)
MGEIRVGTASWTDRTLIESGWYPAGATTAERRLAYYSSQFPLVEVDSTYYGPPAARTARLWAQRTPAGFLFNVKAFSLLTGHPTRPSALYRDLRPDTDKATIYRGDLDPDVVDEVWRRFLEALRPLAEVGKLGAVLFQFPPWFTIRRSNKEYLDEVARRCGATRPVIELRHPSWFAGGNQAETLAFLRERRLPYVCVDMPQGYTGSVPPVLESTADLAVVRLHGHSDAWNSKDIHDKYGYRYSDRELRQWAPKLRALAGSTRQTHVLLNNCYLDYAQRNATRLAELLG